MKLKYNPKNLLVIGFFLIFSLLIGREKAFAAEVTIDSAVGALDSQRIKPSMVWISSTTGFKIYVDGGGTCAWSRTTDSGGSWNAASNITAQSDCLQIAVWYDRWTPGDTTGNIIHTLWAESSGDDVYYDSIITNVNSSPAELAIDTSSGNSYAAADNVTITKATDGALIAGFCNGALAAACSVRRCAATCTNAANWISAGTAPRLDITNDYIILLPIASGNVMLLRDAISADVIQYKLSTVGGTSWPAAWINIASGVVDSTTYKETVVGTVDKSTNNIYLAWGQNVAGAGTARIDTGIFNGSAWTITSSPVAANNTLIALDIGYDGLSGDVYTVYLSGTAGSAVEVYYRKSLDSMNTWTAATRVNTAGGSDMRYVYLNGNSSDRIYAAYYRNAEAILGNNIASLTSPDITWAPSANNFSIYQSAALTWGAGTLACQGTLTDDNGETITCGGGTKIANGTQYRVDALLKNGGGTTVKMNGASDYVDHVNVKAGWAGATPTLGTCGFSDVGSDNGSTTCTAAWNSTNNVRITNTGSGNVNIQAAATEGFMYLITSDTAAASSTSYMNTSLDSITEDSSKITIPKYNIISITTADASVSYGIVGLGANKDTTSGGLNDTQYAINNGETTETFNIKGDSTPCPWILSGSAGAGQYAHSFCITGGGTPHLCDASPVWAALTTGYQELKANAAVGASQPFDLRVTPPLSTACYASQSANVTVQAVEYP